MRLGARVSASFLVLLVAFTTAAAAQDAEPGFQFTKAVTVEFGGTFGRLMRIAGVGDSQPTTTYVRGVMQREDDGDRTTITNADEPRTQENRLGKKIHCYAVDLVSLRQANLAAFFQRVFDRGEKILVLVQRVGIARQQMQLVVFLVRHHEGRRMHSGQQAAGSFQPLLGETPGDTSVYRHCGRLLPRSARHAEDFRASRGFCLNRIARGVLGELDVIGSRLLKFACSLFFHEDPANSPQQAAASP